MGSVVLPRALRVMIPGIVKAVPTDPNWLGFAVEGYVFAAMVFRAFCFSMRATARGSSAVSETGRYQGKLV